ncbi:hypothetical protein GGR57DRAFT_460931 [Xylariaceae sp. FL1272]|nr:hypothetical protein GGR57DRAFT_460931 [Xylariaceae sp. FL1272]
MPQRYSDHLTPPAADGSRQSSPATQSDGSPASSTAGSNTASRPEDKNNSKAIRKRASKPKVRTGCITCKRRHVKCDEGKPTCAECKRVGLACEGYNPNQTSKAQSARNILPRLASTTTLAARPRAGQASNAALVPRQNVDAPKILQRPSVGFSLTDDETWYFTIFKEQIPQELCPHSDSGFWSGTSLRAFMGNECIRHSILSIGAQVHALRQDRENFPEPRDRLQRRWKIFGPSNRHYQAALQHHTRALSHLRSSIQKQGIDDRISMAANLLFIVFEWMMGSGAALLVHNGIMAAKRVRGADAAAESTLQQQRRRYQAEHRDEIDDMTDHFLRFSVSTAYIPFTHGKNAFWLLLTEDPGRPDELTRNPLQDFALRPAKDIRDARRKWDILFPMIAAFQLKVKWHHFNPEHGFDESGAFQQQARFLAQLYNYEEELDNLIIDPEDSTAVERFEVLRLQHLVAFVFVSCCLDRTEQSYDDYLPQFWDILRRCRPLVEKAYNQRSRIGFSSDNSVLMSLCFVGGKCRDQNVRIEALDLILKYDGREGGIESLSLAASLRELMKLEQQSEALDRYESRSQVDESVLCADSRIPPPEYRYAWIDAWRDAEHARFAMVFSKILPDASGEFEKHNVWVYLN